MGRNSQLKLVANRTNRAARSLEQPCSSLVTWLNSKSYGCIVGLGVGIGVPPGLGVGHGFFGSSGVQGVGETVGVGTAACEMLGPVPEVTETPTIRYTTAAATITKMVASESAFDLIFESIKNLPCLNPLS
jgi:hypothetical protein